MMKNKKLFLSLRMSKQRAWQLLVKFLSLPSIPYSHPSTDLFHVLVGEQTTIYAIRLLGKSMHRATLEPPILQVATYFGAPLNQPLHHRLQSSPFLPVTGGDLFPGGALHNYEKG